MSDTPTADVNARPQRPNVPPLVIKLRPAAWPLHQARTRCDEASSTLRFLAVPSPKKPARPVPKLSVHGTVSRSTGRLPLTGAEWVLVAVFAVASFALFGLDAVDAAANNRVYLGAASAAAQDSMQYLAWATDAAHHGLIANLYGFNNGGHVFFHPIWLVTGLLHVDAGVSYLLLLGLWQAAALILLVIVLRRYAQLVLGNDGRARAISLTLALFLVSPFFLFVVNLHFKINGQWTLRLTDESYAVQWISGYFPVALTVTAMIGYLIALERLMETLDRPTLGAELLQRGGFRGRSTRRDSRVPAPLAGNRTGGPDGRSGDLGPAVITAQRPAAAATSGHCSAAGLLPDPAEDRRRLGDVQPGTRPAPGHPAARLADHVRAGGTRLDSRVADPRDLRPPAAAETMADRGADHLRRRADRQVPGVRGGVGPVGAAGRSGVATGP